MQQSQNVTRSALIPELKLLLLHNTLLGTLLYEIQSRWWSWHTICKFGLLAATSLGMSIQAVACLGFFGWEFSFYFWLFYIYIGIKFRLLSSYIFSHDFFSDTVKAVILKCGFQECHGLTKSLSPIFFTFHYLLKARGKYIKWFPWVLCYAFYEALFM